ncbi:MAG: lysostaphin resistance A-like protein [Phycisphaeraceae bacterium]
MPPAFAPPPPPPRRPPLGPLSESRRLRVMLAWSAIGLFTLLTVLVQREAMDLPVYDERLLLQPNIQLTVQSKLAIGTAGLAGSTNPQSSDPQGLMDNVWATVQTPADHVRYVIIYAEVYPSPDDALWVIDHMRENASEYELSEQEQKDLDALETIYTGNAISGEARQRLLDRHQWFGEIATTYNQPEQSDDYRSPRSSGTTVLVIGVLIVLFAGLVLLAGIGMCVLAIVLAAQRKFRLRFRAFPDARETPMLAESIAIFLGVFAITGMMTVYFVHQGRADPALLGLALITLCPLIPFCYRVGWRRFCQLVGLHRGEGFFKEVGCGVLGYLAGIPLIVLGFVVSIVLALVFPVELENPVLDPLSGAGPLGLTLIVLLLVGWAPLVEETLFRGLFFSHCRRWMAWPIAASVTGVVFAAIHPQWVWFIPGLASVGFVLALIREWRDSIIGSMAAHALHNGMVACVLISFVLA